MPQMTFNYYSIVYQVIYLNHSHKLELHHVLVKYHLLPLFSALAPSLRSLGWVNRSGLGCLGASGACALAVARMTPTTTTLLESLGLCVGRSGSGCPGASGAVALAVAWRSSTMMMLYCLRSLGCVCSRSGLGCLGASGAVALAVAQMCATTAL